MEHAILASRELKFANDHGTVAGYGAMFNNVDHGRDRIEPGAFKASLAQRSSIPMMFEHRETIGLWSSVREDSKGLLVAGKISDTTAGRDARELARDGAITGLSIGYSVTKHRYDGSVRVLQQLDLHEVSLVTFPMNDLARVASAKSRLKRGELPSMDDLELLLHEAGFPRRKVKRFMQGGAAALSDEHAAADVLDRLAQRLQR